MDVNSVEKKVNNERTENKLSGEERIYSEASTRGAL